MHGWKENGSGCRNLELVWEWELEWMWVYSRSYDKDSETVCIDGKMERHRGSVCVCVCVCGWAGSTGWEVRGREEGFEYGVCEKRGKKGKE